MMFEKFTVLSCLVVLLGACEGSASDAGAAPASSPESALEAAAEIAPEAADEDAAASTATGPGTEAAYAAGQVGGALRIGEPDPNTASDSLAQAAPALAAQGTPAPAEGECTGVRPTEARAEPSAGEPVECPTCLGSQAPGWALEDFQPQSCGVGQIYGLDQFRGRVTLVVLLSAGCGYCLGQAAKMEELWWELRAAGHMFEFVVVNMGSLVSQQSALIERTSFALFQDTAEVNAWDLHGGSKDDFFIYDGEGVLRAYYPAHGSVMTTLSMDEGYANVRSAILNLLGEDVELPGGGSGVAEDVAP